MANPRVLHASSPTSRSGVSVEYIRTRRMLRISGWYDTYVGIEPVEVPLWRFCRELGIKPRDVEHDCERDRREAGGDDA